MKLNRQQEDAIVQQIDYLIKEPIQKRNAQVQTTRDQQYTAALELVPQVKEYLLYCSNGSTQQLWNNLRLKPYLEQKFPEVFNSQGTAINYNEVLQSVRREAVIFSASAKSVEEILNKLVTKYHP